MSLILKVPNQAPVFYLVVVGIAGIAMLPVCIPHLATIIRGTPSVMSDSVLLELLNNILRKVQYGAVGESRTRMGLIPLDPEPSVSANYTTTA